MSSSFSESKLNETEVLGERLDEEAQRFLEKLQGPQVRLKSVGNLVPISTLSPTYSSVRDHEDFSYDNEELETENSSASKAHLDRLRDLADEIAIEGDDLDNDSVQSGGSGSSSGKAQVGYRKSLQKQKSRSRILIESQYGNEDEEESSVVTNVLERIPSFKFASPSQKNAAQGKSASPSTSLRSQSPGKVQVPGQPPVPSPPKRLPPVSGGSSSSGSGSSSGRDSTRDSASDGSILAAASSLSVTFDPGLRLSIPAQAAAADAGHSHSHSPSPKLTPVHARPLSRDDVNRMIIPPFSPSATARESRSRGSGAGLRSAQGLRASIPEGGSVDTGADVEGRPPLLRQQQQQRQQDDDGAGEGEYLDLSQHNFHGLGTGTGTGTGTGAEESAAGNGIDRALVVTENMFMNRPGTHERPSSTQTKYLSIYGAEENNYYSGGDGGGGGGLNARVSNAALRLRTPVASHLSQQDGFAMDLELSHRSVDSQLTTDTEVGIMAGSRGRDRPQQGGGGVGRSIRSNKRTGQQPPIELQPLPFPFSNRPTLPHVDSHISNPNVNYDHIKAKFMTAEDTVALEKKLKLIRHRKSKALRYRQAMSKRLQQQEEHHSLLSEFSNSQIEATMRYFHQSCNGLSDQSRLGVGHFHIHGGSSSHTSAHAIPSDASAAITDEIKLDELEAVIRKFRRAMITQEEEDYGRGLLTSLEWLLQQLNMTPMEWFSLTDTTRVSQTKLSDEASLRITNPMATHHLHHLHTKGNGKLSYLELVVGIDLLCEKLSEKLSIEANVCAEVAATANTSAPHRNSIRHNAASPLMTASHQGQSSIDTPKMSSGAPPSSPHSLHAPPPPHPNPHGVSNSPASTAHKKAARVHAAPIAVGAGPRLKVIVPLWKRSDIQLLLKHLDPNSDGDISAEELQLAFRNLHGAAHYEQLMREAGPVILRLVQYLADNRLTVRDLFRLIDTDRSNSISCAELKTILFRMPKVGLVGSMTGEDEESSLAGSIGSSSLGSLGSSSLISFGRNSVSNSVSVSSESLATAAASAVTGGDFRSPFKYEAGSRAIRGAAAFGKQNKNVLESKCYDLEKMHLKSLQQDKARRDKAKGSPASPSSPIAHAVAAVPATTPTPASEFLKVSVKNALTPLHGHHVHHNPHTDGLRKTGGSSFPTATHNTEKLAPNSGLDSAAAAAVRERKVLLDPRHAKGLMHYSSVWDRQYRLLDFGVKKPTLLGNGYC